MEKITLLEDVMKHFYEPTVPELWNDHLTLYPEITKTKRFIQDSKIVIPLQIAVNEKGVGSRGETTTLPVPGVNQWDQAYETMKYLYATLYLSGPAIVLSKSKDTLINLLDRSLKGTLSAFYFDWERQMWGKADGYMGAQVGALATATIVVTNVERFRIGMELLGTDLAGTTQVAPAGTEPYIVSDVNYTTNKVTFKVGTNLVATTQFWKNGSTVLTGGALVCTDMNGLGNIIKNTGTFENIDRAVHSYWQSLIVQGATPGTPETMTSLFLMKMLDIRSVIVGEDNLPDMLVGNLGIRRAYKKMMDDNHVPTESMPTKSGFKQGFKFSYGGKDIPIIASRFGWDNSLIGLNLDHLYLSEAFGGQWAKDNGKVLTFDKTTDTYWATFKMYTQLVTDDGRSFVLRNGFTEQ